MRTKEGMKKRIWWDIETSDLNADWGTIFCIGYQIEGEPVKCISITDFPDWEKAPWDDRRVVVAFLNVLEREDVGIEITHYGTNFDIKFLQARMTYHRLRTFPILGHVDTYYIAKSKLAIKRKSLANLAEFMRIRFKKTALKADVWKKAARGDRKSLDYIVKHCVADIRVLRAVYNRLAPLLKRHPVIGNYGDCHVCGSHKLQSRGYNLSTKGGRTRKVQCQDCGAWGSR